MHTLYTRLSTDRCGVCYEHYGDHSDLRGISLCRQCFLLFRQLESGDKDTLGAIVERRNKGNRRLRAIDYQNGTEGGGKDLANAQGEFVRERFRERES